MRIRQAEIDETVERAFVAAYRRCRRPFGERRGGRSRAGEQIAAAKILVGRVEKLRDGLIDLLRGRWRLVSLAVSLAAASAAERTLVIRAWRRSRATYRWRRDTIGRLGVGFGLRFQLDKALDRLRALGGGGIFAGQRDAVARADLVLQLLQSELVGS